MLQKYSEEISRKIPQLDQSTCSSVIAALINCIQTYCEYHNNRDRVQAISEVSKSPGIISRAFVTRHVRSRLGKLYREYGRQFEDVLFEIARTTSIDDLEKLFEELDENNIRSYN